MTRRFAFSVQSSGFVANKSPVSAEVLASIWRGRLNCDNLAGTSKSCHVGSRQDDRVRSTSLGRLLAKWRARQSAVGETIERPNGGHVSEHVIETQSFAGGGAGCDREQFCTFLPGLWSSDHRGERRAERPVAGPDKVLGVHAGKRKIVSGIQSASLDTTHL